MTTPGQIYTIGPFDELDIAAFNLPDMNKKVRVDASGYISLPLAGTVQASGATPQELATRIEHALIQNHVRNPQVSVNVSDVVSQAVSVGGEVTTPGIYPVVGKTSLLRVLAKAQGATQYARLSRVVVFRKVGGQSLAALYDVRAIRQGYYADPDIYANDIVEVGANGTRRFFSDVVSATGLITTPLVLLLR